MSLRQIPCPHCHQPATWEGNEFRPFCSERCRLIDLGAWVSDGYRIPGPDLLPEVDNDENNH